MNNEEALRHFEALEYEILDPDSDDEQYAAFQAAKAALEKQVPKMVVKSDKFDEYAHCPTCDLIHGGVYWGKRYCDGCGQRLRW